jgi:Zn-dependent M16 (insulinase) family peptidase
LQARENSEDELCTMKMLELLYPEGSGYKSNTGGIMANLRELKNAGIKQYHSDFYRPENLTIIVTGTVSFDGLDGPQAIFKALEPIEAAVLAKRGGMTAKPYAAVKPHARPWNVGIPPTPTANIGAKAYVEFPSEDESTGSVMLAWRGGPWADLETATAVSMLANYLCRSPVSPLQKVFVETEDEPLCNDVYFGKLAQVEYMYYFKFDNVEFDRLEEVQGLFQATLADVVKDSMDMERLASVIHRSGSRYKSGIEQDPHNCIAGDLIEQMLYATREDPAKEAEESKNMMCGKLERLENLPTGADDGPFWLKLLQDVFMNDAAPPCVVIAKPSAAKAAQISDEETARVTQRKETEGEAGLEVLEKALLKSIEQNEIPIPDDVVEKVPIPKVDKIVLTPVVRTNVVPSARKSATSGSILSAELTMTPTDKKHHDLLNAVQTKMKASCKAVWGGDDGENGPVCPVQMDHIQTAFVSATVCIDTTLVPDDLRPFIELYLDAVFDLPVQEGDLLLPHETVVKELQNDTVSFSNDCGIGGDNFQCGTFSQVMNLRVTVEASKSHRAVTLLRRALFDSVFSEERLSISATKLLSDVAQYKRSESSCMRAFIKSMNYDATKSNHEACNFLRQQILLTQIIEDLKTNPEKVTAPLRRLKEILTAPQNMRVFVVCDLLDMDTDALLQQWDSGFVPPKPNEERAQGGPNEDDAILPHAEHFPPTHSVRKSETEEFALAYSQPSFESGYLVQTCQGPSWLF